MSDPRYPDPLNDPVRTDRRDPLQPGTPRYQVEEDSGRTGMWAWIVGIIAVIVIAMVVYDYNRPISTASSPPVSPPSTTGAASPPLNPPSTTGTIPDPAPPPAPAPKSP
jgi:hypothetical protein